MNLHYYLRLARRFAWLLIVLPIVASLAALIVSLILPPIWESDVAILVKPAQPLAGSDPTVSVLTADQVSRTYARLMVQRPLLDEVIRDLSLHVTPQDLAKTIKVGPDSNTTILNVSVQTTDPKLSRSIAGTLVDDFIRSTQQIQQKQLEQYTIRLTDQIQTAESAITLDQAQIDRLDATISQRAPTAAEQAQLANLRQQLSTDEARRNDLTNSLAQFQAQAARSSDNLVVVSPATLPDQPVSPRKLLDLGAGLAAGLVVAVLLVLLLDQLDQSIKTDEELIQRTGLIPMGHIPFTEPLKSRRGELVTLSKENSPAVEAYKALRTNLMFSGVDRELKTITITSSVPGEGKSRTAANLAVVLAQAGHNTLLIDADFRRPTLHRIFARVRNEGLSNLILNQSADKDLIQSVDDVPNLWLLSSGHTPPNPSELLGSRQLKNLLAQFRQSFNYILIDTPPVNAVTDGALVAAATDGVVMVVEFGRTSHAAVTNARHTLDRTGATPIGAIVNKLQNFEREGYSYGGYEMHEVDKPASRARAAGVLGGRRGS